MSNQDNYDSQCAYQQEQEHRMWFDAQESQNERNKDNQSEGDNNESAKNTI